jgi:hypothetical protein
VRAVKQLVVRYGFEEHPDPHTEPAEAVVKAPKGA